MVYLSKLIAKNRNNLTKRIRASTSIDFYEENDDQKTNSNESNRETNMNSDFVPPKFSRTIYSN